jgi:hypothetical protein
MYVFGHTAGTGVAGTVGGLEPKELGDRIKALVIKEIRKLCLIACNAAKGDSTATQDVLVEGNPSFLTRLCETMAIDGLLMAGWKEIVTFSQEGRDVRPATNSMTKIGEQAKKEQKLLAASPFDASPFDAPASPFDAR